MSLDIIDKKLNLLVNNHQTRDPFKLADKLGVKIIMEDLGGIYGYYNKELRIKFIHLNNHISEDYLNFTCAHELAHSIFHSDSNTPFLSAQSLTSSLKIEMEANYFASNLRMDGSHEGLGIDNKYTILDYYNLPLEMERFLYK